MKLQNWWEKNLLDTKPRFCQALQKEISCDYLILGGGVAGLHAALRLAEEKKDVVLLEKTICGGSSSGRSSGFLTPDSELEVYQLIRRYGKKGSQIVWNIPVTGVHIIRSTAEKYHIHCDLEKQDSLYVGMGKTGKDTVQEEADARQTLHFSYRLYSRETLPQVLGTSHYSAGLRTGETFGINMMLYCYGLKKILLQKGVRIFEHSEVLSLQDTTACTAKGKATGKKIIVCIDKMKKNISPLAKKSYHAQTFLAISRPLTKKQVDKLFPDGKLMVWDSRLIYSYYRLTKDNRLLIGGGSALSTYDPWYFNSPFIIERVIQKIKALFSPLFDLLLFDYYWPGQIDISKDIMPIVDYDPHNKNVQFVIGNPGLPWAAFSGVYATERFLGKGKDLSRYLGMNRTFFISDEMQCFLGKIPSFAINNLYSLYFQKDER